MKYILFVIVKYNMLWCLKIKGNITIFLSVKTLKYEPLYRNLKT